MSEEKDSKRRPDWLEEFENLANDQLGEGSSCQQVHPIVERWYTDLLQSEPPQSRDSVMQAMACLSTEVMIDTPEELLDKLMEDFSEDEIARWIEYILMIGRAFEISLRKGDLDDL